MGSYFLNSLRYDLSDEKRKQKEQFISKERDDAVRKARERRLAEMRVSLASI